jgi:isocitrate dehydrogenase
LFQLPGKKGLSTNDFADAIIKHMPETLDATAERTTITFTPPPKPVDTRMLLTKRNSSLEKTVGMDLFVDSPLKPKEVADILLPLIPKTLKLVMLSNRGTQVWPTGSLFTECVNHYRCRLEVLNPADSQISESKLLELASVISQKIRVCSLEMLMMQGSVKLYSLAQGQ